jgi:hypothetical protein
MTLQTGYLDQVPAAFEHAPILHQVFASSSRGVYFLSQFALQLFPAQNP